MNQKNWFWIESSHQTQIRTHTVRPGAPHFALTFETLKKIGLCSKMSEVKFNQFSFGVKWWNTGNIRHKEQLCTGLMVSFTLRLAHGTISPPVLIRLMLISEQHIHLELPVFGQLVSIDRSVCNVTPLPSSKIHQDFNPRFLCNTQ